MTHYDISYSKSPAPNFDAVQDIIEWLGIERFQHLSKKMMEVKHCGTWRMALSLAGIQGFPVIAWYEHIHGQGSWIEPTWEN
jgi:hypothetical protein